MMLTVTNPNANSAVLFISNSVLCTPGMELEELEGLVRAIDWAKEHLGIRVFILRTETTSDAFRRATGYLVGATSLSIHSHEARYSMKRILRQIAGDSRGSVTASSPSAVWWLTDTVSLPFSRKTDRELFEDVQGRMHWGGVFRILALRWGEVIDADDLTAVFMDFARLLSERDSRP